MGVWALQVELVVGEGFWHAEAANAKLSQQRIAAADECQGGRGATRCLAWKGAGEEDGMDGWDGVEKKREPLALID
ncbi:hypothetical protein ACLOJK_007648 [Asimina triloba]